MAGGAVVPLTGGVVVLIVLLLLRARVVKWHSVASPWLEGIGLALFCLGLGLAIWARHHSGDDRDRDRGQPLLADSGDCAGRVFRLQRPHRRAVYDRPISRHLSGVQALVENADPLHPVRTCGDRWRN